MIRAGGRDRGSRRGDGPPTRYTTRMFDMLCQEHGIEHRLSKSSIPGPVAKSSMNGTVNEENIQRYHHDQQLVPC